MALTLCVSMICIIIHLVWLKGVFDGRIMIDWNSTKCACHAKNLNKASGDTAINDDLHLLFLAHMKVDSSAQHVGVYWGIYNRNVSFHKFSRYKYMWVRRNFDEFLPRDV